MAWPAANGRSNCTTISRKASPTGNASPPAVCARSINRNGVIIMPKTFEAAALLSIAVFNPAALLVSLGSGTSGGLLAPMFMAGTALGALFTIVGNALLQGAPLEPAAFALVGMAAFFAAALRATFALIVFAFEITRNYDAIPTIPRD